MTARAHVGGVTNQTNTVNRQYVIPIERRRFSTHTLNSNVERGKYVYRFECAPCCPIARNRSANHTPPFAFDTMHPFYTDLRRRLYRLLTLATLLPIRGVWEVILNWVFVPKVRYAIGYRLWFTPRRFSSGFFYAFTDIAGWYVIGNAFVHR